MGFPDPVMARPSDLVKSNLTAATEEHLAGSAVYGEDVILRLTKGVTTTLACMRAVVSIIVWRI
jgi:hypothetical protein